MQRINSGGPSRRKLLDAHLCTSLAEKAVEAQTYGIEHNVLGYSLNFSRCSRGKEKESKSIWVRIACALQRNGLYELGRTKFILVHF